MQDKGQHQKRKEKRLVDELPAAVLADQAAHNSFASGYVGGVIDCLEGRYVPNLKAREYSDDQVRAKIDEIVRKAAEAGIVFTADQIDYFKNFATRKQDAWDSALIFKGGAEETIELPMNKVVTLLLSSFEDDQQFKYSKTFKQRVEKLQGWLANTMNRKQVCNVGRRNDFVGALLEGDYFLEILPERCVQVIYDQHLFLKRLLSQFFENHWHIVYAKSPERASKILLEWRTGIALGYLDGFLERGATAESVPIEQQKGQFEEELKSYLKTRVSHTFISPARWETPIMNMVVTRNLSDCPIIEEYRTQIQALDEVHQFLSQQTSDKETQALFDSAKKQLITDLVDIGKFNSPKIKGLSVFVRLYQQALPYRNILAIGAQEQRFVAIARAVIDRYEHPDLLRWFLGQEISENSPVNTVDAEVLESQFSESKQAYRVGISAEIENSFAVLAECEGREKTERFNSYRRKILDAGFLVDERAFQSWYTQFLQVSEDQTSVAITLTPLAINKIIWQGLLSCPSQWTPTFTVAFGQVLALLKKLEEEGDEVQNLYRRSSFLTEFVVQLHWMLQIARDPLHDLQVDKMPAIYLPVTLVSCTADLKKIGHRLETALTVAVKCGSAEQVKAFLDDERLSAEVVCHADKDGDTALHRAADRGNTEIVKVLLASDKLPSEAVCHTDLYRRTALHIAVREGNTEIVKVLLASDKLPSEAVCHADRYGKIALHRAAAEGHTEIVKVLLASDKLPSEAVCHADRYGKIALHWAAAKGHTEIVKVLLASDKLPSEAVCRANRDGETALHCAANQDHTEIVRLLLASDKLPSEAVCRANRNGETVLNWAALQGRTEIVRLLLASDKLPSEAVCHAYRDGETILHWAALQGHTEIVRLLLASDKLPSEAVCHADINGKTALHWAAARGHTEIVKVLLASDKLPSEAVCHANSHGRTALHWAAAKGHTEIVKVLLESDKLPSEAVCHADIYGGRTALHLAAAEGHTEIVKVLLASDKLPSEAVCHAYRDGKTVLHWAAIQGRTDIVRVLLASDKLTLAAVCRVDEVGRTALLLAEKSGHTAIVRELKNWLAAHEERARLVSATQNQVFGGDSEGAPILKAPAKKAVLVARVPAGVTGQPQFFGGDSTGAPVLKAPLKRAVLVARHSKDNGKINLSLTESNFEHVCKSFSDSHKKMSEQMKVVEWLEKHSTAIKEQKLRPEFIVGALVHFVNAEGDRKTVEKLLISFGLERLFSLEPYSPTGPGFFSRLFSSAVYSVEAARAYYNLMSEHTHFTEGQRAEIRKLVGAEGGQSPLCDFLKTAHYRQKVEAFRSAEHKITGAIRPSGREKGNDEPDNERDSYFLRV